MPDEEDSLHIDYRTHNQVRELIDNIRYVLECVSLGFEKWDEDYARGPGLYIAIVTGTSVGEYADPMGDNYWPVNKCADTEDIDSFYDAAVEVAEGCDGAVVVSVDGAIQRQMVRFRDISPEDSSGAEVDYADWMGSRHMSAVDTSTHHEVIVTLTLSEETGRVTVFTDGEYEDVERDEIAPEWRDS